MVTAMTELQDEAVRRLKGMGYSLVVPPQGPVPVGGPVVLKSPDGRLWTVLPDGSVKENR